MQHKHSTAPFEGYTHQISGNFEVEFGNGRRAVNFIYYSNNTAAIIDNIFKSFFGQQNAICFTISNILTKDQVDLASGFLDDFNKRVEMENKLSFFKTLIGQQVDVEITCYSAGMDYPGNNTLISIDDSIIVFKSEDLDPAKHEGNKWTYDLDPRYQVDCNIEITPVEKNEPAQTVDPAFDVEGKTIENP